MKGLIFTYVMTYGGALVALFNPFIGLLIYVCFAIIRPEALWHWSVPPGSYSRIIAMALVAGWGLNGFGNWRLGRATPIVLAFLAFWLWACLSATQARNGDRAWVWVEGQAKILLPFLVGITLINSTNQLKQLAWVIALSHAYVAYDLNLSYYEGPNRLQQFGFGGMDNNSFAITFCAGTGLAFFLGLNAPKLWIKLLAFVSALLMMHAVFFSFSRGGMLGLIITALVSFVLIPKQLKHYLAFAVCLMLAFRLAGAEVVNRFVSAFASQEERDASAQSRVEMWRICMDQLKANPIVGLGPNNFGVYASDFGLTANKEAHSLWLQTGAEVGVPGLTFLAGFYGLCVIRLWPYARQKRPVSDPWFGDVARMVVAAIVGFAVAAQFVSLPGLETPYYIVLLGAGALKLTSMDQVAVQRTAYIYPHPNFARNRFLAVRNAR